MTSTLIPSTSRNENASLLLHWKTWVVPSAMLKEFVYEHKHIWQFRFSPLQNEVAGWEVGNTGSKGEDQGWRTHLSLEIASVTGQSFSSTYRNLYRITADEGLVINIDFAEAIVMSLGLFIDQDTNIPVLPGNLRNAEELLEVRDSDFWSRSRDERRYLQRIVMELSNEIVKDIERMEIFQDAAPFDCLRPPRSSATP